MLCTSVHSHMYEHTQMVTRAVRVHMCLKFDLNSYNNSTKLPYSNVCKFCIRKGHTKHRSNFFARVCVYACVYAYVHAFVGSFVWSQIHVHNIHDFTHTTIRTNLFGNFHILFAYLSTACNDVIFCFQMYAVRLCDNV